MAARTTTRATPEPVFVGVSDHSGWAILMTVTARGELLDRRRIELVDDGLPTMPHHHDGQKMPIDDAVALVEQVQRSAERNAVARLEALASQIGGIRGVALRVCPPLPDTIAERITSYRAMCVADWIMYRRALASAAEGRGWSVHWYDAKRVLDEAAVASGLESIEAVLDAAKRRVGPPWQKDHRMAMAAAIAAGAASGE